MRSERLQQDRLAAGRLALLAANHDLSAGAAVSPVAVKQLQLPRIEVEAIAVSQLQPRLVGNDVGLSEEGWIMIAVEQLEL